MGKWRSSIKKWMVRLAPNAIWRVIEWIGGSSMMGSIGRYCWLEYHRSPVDWQWLACLLGAGLLLVALGLMLEHKKTEPPIATSEPTPADRDDRVPIWQAVQHIAILSTHESKGPDYLPESREVIRQFATDGKLKIWGK